jgi:hypothetical protein
MKTLNRPSDLGGNDPWEPQCTGDWRTCRCRAHRIKRHLLYKWLLGLGAAAGVIANFRTAVDTIYEIIQFIERVIGPLLR